MQRISVMLLGLLLAAAVVSAVEPDYLIQIERRSDYDRAALLDLGIPLVHESLMSLFAEAEKKDVGRLEELGYRVMNLCSMPRDWDFYLIGLRPDSDRGSVQNLGTVLFEEENWVLLRVARGTDPAPLYDARAFVSPLGRKVLQKARPTQPQALRGPEAFNVVPLVQQMVASVNTADIDAFWNTLAPPNGTPTPTRYTSVAGCGDDSTYCYNQFASFGLQAQYQDYAAGTRAPNAIGVQTGAVNPGNVYIVVGHLDDMPSTGYAPGADDNASGTVVVLEAARVMSCYAFKNTVKYIAVTGEETGLEGSEAYAAAANAGDENILGVLNFDMPGWAGDNIPVGENLDLNYDANSQALALHVAACAADYGTGLAVDAFLCPSLTASDHYPFWQNGFRAVCGITDNEGYCGHNGHYPYYHTADDTIANCGNKGFFYAVNKAAIASLAELAEPFKITLDKTSYACNGTLQIIVGDKDLNTNTGTVQTLNIQASSTTEPTPETVALTEESVNSMIFRGTFPLSALPAANGDGKLSVSAGDTITVRYVDALDCNGAASVTYTATAATDCTPPVISNVQVSGITDSSAVVTWTTNEAANSRVTYGTATPPATNKDDLANYVTSHSVTLTGLTGCTKYYFSVTSADVATNSATNNNGGTYFSFTTYGRSFIMGPDNVEGTVLSWVVSPTTGTDIWHQDACKSVSGAKSWKVGKSDAPTCTAQYASSLSNYYLTWNANINLGASGHGYHLLFSEWYDTESNTGCTYDPIRVQISTDGGTNWTTLATNCGASGGWLARDYDLAAYTGSTVRIRFWFTSDGSANGLGWFIDDISVSKAQSCTAEPTYQSVTFTDACSGTGAGNANGIIDSGEDITIHPVLKNMGSQAGTGISATLSTSTPNVTVTGATAGYPDLAVGASAACNAPHFTVRVGTGVACGTVMNFTLTITAASGGPWTQNFSLTVGTVTPAGGTLFSENFDGVTAPAVPAGWAQTDTSGTAGTWATNAGTRYPSGGGTNTSPNVAYFNSFTASSGNATRLYRTSGFAIPAASTAATLTFYMYHDTGYSTNNDTIQPQVSTNGGSTWTNVGSAIARYAATAAWTQHTVSLNTYIGQADVRIAFLGTSTYGNDCHIDTVVVTNTAPGGCAMNACTPSASAPPPVKDSGTTAAKFTKGSGNALNVTYDSTTCSAQKVVILHNTIGTWTGYAGCAQSNGGSGGSTTIDSAGQTATWYNLVWTQGTTAGHPGFATSGARSWNVGTLCGMAADDKSKATCP